MTNSSRSSTLTLATAGSVAAVLAVFYLRRKRAKKVAVKPNETRKRGRTSHIYIPTTNAQQSSQFFTSFGLQQVSSHDHDRTVVLVCPNQTQRKHEPFIMLQEVPAWKDSTTTSTPPPSSASDVGIGRLCLGVKNVEETVERLRREWNLSPIAPPVCDRPGSPNENGVNREPKVVIVAYRDPASGTMLELVSLPPSLPLKITVGLLQTFSSLEFPLFVHANINTCRYERGLAAYRALGYSKIAKHYGRVVNSLYKALQTSDPGMAKQVTMIQTPEEDLFCLDLIEWEDPPTTATAAPKSNSDKHTIRIAITVHDLPNELDQILAQQTENEKLSDADVESPLWTLAATPMLKDYPLPLGKALVASIQDPDGIQVDVVEYPLALVNMTVPDNVQQKLVVISGCDSGFGRTLACRMALLGFPVLAVCYTEKGATYLRRVVTETVVADLFTNKGVKIVIDKCRDLLNQKGCQLWAIVNNAGVCYPGNAEWQAPYRYQQAMQVNFHAPVSIIHALIKDLKACPGSRILQVSSVCGMLPQPTNSTYCASKHALESYSDCLRCELRAYGVHVCIVQPATMKTPLGLSYWDSWLKGYHNAPKERKDSFHSDKIDDFVQKNQKALHDAAEDPDVTTSAMVKALLEPNPPTRLRTGVAAEVFFRPVSCLPDKTRDAILWNLMGFDSVLSSNTLAEKRTVPSKLQPKNRGICPICSAVVKFPSRMSYLTLHQLQIEEQQQYAKAHAPPDTRTKQEKEKRKPKILHTSRTYLDEFFSSPYFQKLCAIEYHAVNNLESLRKEITESYAIVRALESLTNATTRSSAIPSNLSLDDVFFVDLCSGKSLFCQLGALMFPNATFLAIDKMPEQQVSHFPIDSNINYWSYNLLYKKIDEHLREKVQAQVDQGKIPILVGMHLCGQLSEVAIDLFAKIPAFRALVLCPCCLPGKKHDYRAKAIEAGIEAIEEDMYEYWANVHLSGQLQSKVSDLGQVQIYRDNDMHTIKNCIMWATRG